MHMARQYQRHDWEIFWVLVVAAIGWGVLWQHELVSTWVHKLWISRSKLF